MNADSSVFIFVRCALSHSSLKYYDGLCQSKLWRVGEVTSRVNENFPAPADLQGQDRSMKLNLHPATQVMLNKQ